MHGPFLRFLSCLLVLGATAALPCRSETAPADPPRWEPLDVPRLGREFTRDEPPPSDRPYWRRNLFKRVAGDQKFLVTTWWPAEARRTGFSLPVGLALISASQTGGNADAFDVSFARTVQGWTADDGNEAALFFTRLGDVETAAVLLGGSYLASRWSGNRRLERATSLSAEALINSTVYVSVLKRATRRTRPTGGTGEFFVSAPGPGESPTSFPSGHATGAFALAAVFAAEYRERRWVAWVSYGTASLIAVSRVSLGRHFPSDVIAGAVLGQSIGSMVVYRSSGDDRPRPAWSRLRPYVDPDHGGLGVTYGYSW